MIAQGAGWHKSSRSTGQNNCVEVRLRSTPEIRDSKRADGPVLRVSRSAFTALVQAL